MMTRMMMQLGRWSSREICSVVASVFWAASASQAVPIDLTDATPTVSSATTLHIEGIATLGSNYWADFEWNENTNKFDVSGYGEEGGSEIPEGFVFIEPGTFTMGSPEDESGRSWTEAQHEVTLTRGFLLSEIEVTQGQWLAMMGTNPSRYPGCDDCPVERVTWNEAVDYCNALSDLEGLNPAYQVNGTHVSWDQSANGYRLPTESEWEYACRAGTTTAFHNGPVVDKQCEDPNLDRIGWYCGTLELWRSKEVAQKEPNAWGLYDMSGNVYEWCWDWHKYEYPVGSVTDPVGPDSGAKRVLRGGSWASMAQNCRSAGRAGNHPGLPNLYLGLRLARSAP